MLITEQSSLLKSLLFRPFISATHCGPPNFSISSSIELQGSSFWSSISIGISSFFWTASSSFRLKVRRMASDGCWMASDEARFPPLVPGFKKYGYWTGKECLYFSGYYILRMTQTWCHAGLEAQYLFSYSEPLLNKFKRTGSGKCLSTRVFNTPFAVEKKQKYYFRCWGALEILPLQ
jgi:hypothetical protein